MCDPIEDLIATSGTFWFSFLRRSASFLLDRRTDFLPPYAWMIMLVLMRLNMYYL